ncbi:MAG TPA: hypothetical protein PKC28_04110, partial [Bdellovibrionales bacterium]|nr:hypothetical protein [Bdellovibrionales bacterium]
MSILICALILTIPDFALAQSTSPAKLSLSGALFEANGQPVANASVDFRLEILDRNNTCVLYRETHLSQNLSQSSGRFSLQVGAGSGPENLIDSIANPTVLSAKIFENPGFVPAFTGCVAGVALAPGDQRNVKIY